MARDIPGYYFDAEKGKYFKVQPNHAVPSAVKYSKQAVDAQKATAKRRRLEDKAQTRRLQETTQRSRLLEYPFHRLRLRSAFDGVVARPNVTTEVAAYYGASLSRRTVLGHDDHLPGLIQKFAIDEVTAAMITASSSSSSSFRGSTGVPLPGHNFVHHWPHSRQQSSKFGPYTGLKYGIMPTEEPVSALLITPRPLNFVMWATPAGSHHPGSIRIVPFGRSLERAGAGEGLPEPPDDDDDEDAQQEQQWANDAAVAYDGDMGIAYTIPECDIWAMAASLSGQRVVAGCTSGLCVFASEVPRAQAQQHQQGWGSTMHRRGTDTEFMAVAFKDEHVVFAGTRSGAVHMADLRSGLTGTTTRLRHASGVTAIRALSDDNYVVVRGLETMSIYDLRYTPLAKSLSKPYMTFGGGSSASSSYASDRFGLGFDYDPGLGLIATAHSSPSASLFGQTGHHISLFSTRTGKLVSSPINTHAFSAPVTCIQFTNAIRARSNLPFAGDIVGDDGRPRENNEPKSIVTASGADIDEWSVQGLGGEDGRQE